MLAGGSHLPLPTMIKELNLRIKKHTEQTKTKCRMLAPDSRDVYKRNDFSKLRHLNLPILEER